MREFFNIFKDVKSGVLPMSEVPGFMLWAVKKSRRVFWLALLVMAAVIWVRDRLSK